MAVRAYWKGSLGCCCRHCEERLVRRSSTSEGGSDEAMHAFSIQFSNSSDRHCEERSDEAIHRAAQRKNGLLRRFAPRNDGKHTLTANTRFATSPRDAPEPLIYLPPKEGVGNAGCPLHPRPRVHLVVVERTRVTTSTPESPDVPARNGFNGFLRALPGDRALLPPSPCGLKVLSSPVEPNEPPQDLTPASRRQDHTTSPYAATSLVRSLGDRSQAFRQPALQPRRAQNAAASTASHPASVTIAIRPSG